MESEEGDIVCHFASFRDFLLLFNHHLLRLFLGLGLCHLILGLAAGGLKILLQLSFHVSARISGGGGHGVDLSKFMGFLLWEIVEAFPGGEIFPFAYDALDGFGFSHGPASGHQLGVAASGELAVGLAELWTHRHARHLQKIIIAHKFKFAELSELFLDGTMGT